MKLYEERGVVSDELKKPPAVPPHVSHVFEWFLDLNNTRRNYVGMSFAHGPISFVETKSYLELHGIKASLFELELLRSFDLIYLNTMCDGE